MSRPGRGRTRRPTLLAALAALLILAAVPVAAGAQVPTLDRVDSLMTAGDYDAARADLERWWSAREQFDVPGSDRARGLMLRARLNPDPGAAEPDYLAVVLGYPASEHAPDALLRLGQGLLATGQPARAAAYLQRLVADYPGRPQRTTGLLWLARAQAAASRPDAACRAAREGLQDARDQPELSALFRVEEAATCAIGGPAVAADEARDRPAGQPATTRQPPPQQRAERAAERPVEPAQPAATGRFAVQSGAFRYREGADALLDRLRRAGHDARMVRVPANDLLRVRVGRFPDVAAARALVRRLQSAGFDAVLVSDAHQEREP